MDCTANQKLCMDNKILAFPTLRHFQNGVAQPPDYQNDRTVDALMNYVRTKVSIQEQLKGFTEEELAVRNARIDLNRDDHPGCMLSGMLTVNRQLSMAFLSVQYIHSIYLS